MKTLCETSFITTPEMINKLRKWISILFIKEIALFNL